MRRAAGATYTAFAGAGFAFASWASRIPQVRDHLHLSPAALGLVLLAIAVGSLVALPASGPLVARIGSQRTVAAMAAVMAVALAVVAVGSTVVVVPVVVGLALLGLASGAWDVAMNVQGAAVERRLGRSVMSRFHAGFSVGTVAGALLGAAAVAAHVPVAAHLLVVAAIVGAGVPVHVRRFLPDHSDHSDQSEEPAPAVQQVPEPSTGSAAAGALAAWREPRTLLIGVCVLGFAFAEGAGNDWASIAAIDGYDLPPALGTLVFATFLGAMTAGRWVGPPLLDRYGRLAVVRALAAVAVAGLLVFIWAPVVPAAFLGAALWGLGASLGFPVGMSAAADDPRVAAARVSAVASVGYCAFLAGPPLIGFLGDRVGTLHALAAVTVLLAGGLLAGGSLQPPQQPLVRGARHPDTTQEPSAATSPRRP